MTSGLLAMATGGMIVLFMILETQRRENLEMWNYLERDIQAWIHSFTQ